MFRASGTPNERASYFAKETITGDAVIIKGYILVSLIFDLQAARIDFVYFPSVVPEDIGYIIS